MAPKKKPGQSASAGPPVPEEEAAAPKADEAPADADADAEEFEAAEEHAEEEQAEEETAGDIDEASGVAASKDAGTEAPVKTEGEDEEVPQRKMPKGKEPPKELEQDAAPDDRARVAPGAVALSEYDSTLDAFFSGGGNIVSSLSQGGFQHLLSGVRANTGVKAGRHYFEVKVLEKKPTEAESTLRLGVSLAKSSLFLGDATPDSAGFDMNGTYFSPTPEDASHSQQKTLLRKVQFQVIGILLNLDAGTPNANTLSVFLDGVRLSEPMPLPTQLLGQALYPTITFKNYTLAVNLGSEGLVMKRLPFSCSMFGNAAKADTESASFPAPPAGSKYSVVLPVGLPDEGLFDYADNFLASHPDFVELSDRQILEWCVKSGLTCKRRDNLASSRDRPAFNFGIASIDNKGVRHSLRTLTQLVKRNYLVVELKGNLTSKDRQELRDRFCASHYSVTTHVAVGEPTAKHKDWVHTQITAAHAKKQAEALATKKKIEAREAERAQRIAGKKEVKEGVKEEDEPPLKKVKLESEEKAEPGPDVGAHVWYLPNSKQEEISTKILGQSYSAFTLPSDSEGFDKVEFVWATKAAAEEHLQKWIVEKKATLIIEDLKPGQWFQEKKKTWGQLCRDMKMKKASAARKDKKDGEEAKDDAAEKKEEETVDPIHAGGEDGKALYADFKHEDWVLLGWRYDLHLLVHAWQSDAEDAKLVGIPTEHISHYYNLYFSRQFNPKSLGCAGLSEVVDLCDETLKIETKGNTQFIVPLLDKETEPIVFLKSIEEYREDRMRRIEAGDESCRLKINDAESKGDGFGKKLAKGKGKRREKGKEGEKGEKGGKAGGKTAQEGAWPVAASGFASKSAAKRMRQLARFQQGEEGQKGGKPWAGGQKGGKRELPATAATPAPWNRPNFARPRAKGFGKAPGGGATTARAKGFGKSPRFAQNFAGKGRQAGNSGFDTAKDRIFEDRRGAAGKRPAPQQEHARFPPRAQQKGGGKEGPPQRHYGNNGPEAKRARYEPPPVPPKVPISPVSRPNQASHQRPSSNGQPSRGGPPSAPVGKGSGQAAGKGGYRDQGQGGSRDSKGHGRDTSRDAGFRDGGRPSQSSSSKSYGDKGSSKGGGGGDRRPSDSGKDRYPSSSKGGAGKGGRDQRRDGPPDTRSYPSSGDRQRPSSSGGRDQREQGRRSW